MTTAPTPRLTAQHGPASRPVVTFARVLASERTKLLSLRSTLWVALGTVLTAATLTLTLGMLARTDDGHPAAALVVAGAALVQLGPLVLGVLVGTAEHTTGAVRTTYTAVPRRLPVLGAQAVVTAAVAAATAVAALLASLLVALALHGPGSLDLSADQLRMLGAYPVVLTGVALVGLGAGSLLRRPAAALVAGAVLLVVVDQVLASNPGHLTDTVRALLPGAGLRTLHSDAQLALDAASQGPHLGAWGGLLVLSAWAAGLLLTAAQGLRHRDLT